MRNYHDELHLALSILLIYVNMRYGDMLSVDGLTGWPMLS